jgi:NADPH:quinone reductase
VNPSDYGEWKNMTESFQPKPVGKEGSGVVVLSGGGVYANSCVGSKVGFIVDSPTQGSYSEYVTVDALKGIFPLPDIVPVEDAASHFVNPYTVYGIVDTARTTHTGKGTLGFIHTGAASQLGQMMVKYCTQEKVTLINIVRREEQAEILRSLGAQHIIVSNSSDWEEQLKTKIKELDIRIAFECVSGEMTGKLLSLLPSKSTLFVYGSLSGTPCSGIEPLDLIYRKKRVEGWLLPTWLLNGDPVTMLMRIRAATSAVHGGLVKGGWAESQFDDCTMSNMIDRFRELIDNGFTGRKLRIRMDVDPAAPAEALAAEAEAAVAVNEKKEDTEEEVK